MFLVFAKRIKDKSKKQKVARRRQCWSKVLKQSENRKKLSNSEIEK